MATFRYGQAGVSGSLQFGRRGGRLTWLTDQQAFEALKTDGLVAHIRVPLVPAHSNDAVSKNYVDTLVQGLSPKDSVRVATTAAGNLATDFANGAVIDGVLVSTGNRILIKDQADAAQNGIYTVNASGTPSRSADASDSGKLGGAMVMVEEGTAHGNQLWYTSFNSTENFGTTAKNWSRLGSVTGTALGVTVLGDTVTVTSSTGDDAVIPVATTSTAGLMVAADKTKLNAIEAGATADQTGAEIEALLDTELGNIAWKSGTDLSSLINANSVQIQSSTGAATTLNSASGIAAGIMTAADKTKLDGIETGATADQTGAEIEALLDTELGSTDWKTDRDTDLDAVVDEDSVVITSSTGTDATIPTATTTDAGVLSAADKTKLDGIETGATADMSGAEIVSAIDTELGGTTWQSGGGAGSTDLSVTRDGTSVTVVSSTGDDAVISTADGSNAGVLSAADKTKLDGIEAGATTDQTGAEIKALYEGEADTNAFTDAEKTKLAGIEVGAEVNPTGAEIVSLIDTELGGTTWQSGGGAGGNLVDLSDVNITTGAGVDGYAVVWDNDTSRFVLAEMTGGSGTTNLSVTRDGTSVTVASSTGDDAVLPVADGSNAGVLSAADKTKLDGIETGAEVNPTGAEIVSAIDAQLGGTTWQSGGGGGGTVEFKGARVVQQSAQTIQSTNTVLSFAGGEVFDNGDWFSDAEPTKFIVPAGVSKVIFNAGFVVTSTTNVTYSVFLLKNNVPYARQTLANCTAMVLDSGVVDVAEGDEFQLGVIRSTGTTPTDPAYTFMTIIDVTAGASGGAGGGASTLDDLSDVDTSITTDGYVLTSQGDGTYAFEAPPGGGASALDDLSDVSTTGATEGQVLTVQSGGTFAFEDLPSGPGGSIAWHGARVDFDVNYENNTGVWESPVFDNVDIDTDSFISGNTYVIPAGVTKIKLSAFTRFHSLRDQNQWKFYKNGLALDQTNGGSQIGIPDAGTYGDNGIFMQSGVLSVAENDVFELRYYTASENWFMGWFQLDVLEGSMLDAGGGPVAINLGSLNDVDASDTTAGYVLTREADGSFAMKASAANATATTLTGLTDVDASETTDGYALVRNGASGFEFRQFGTNLSTQYSNSTIIVYSDNGTDATLLGATGTEAGLMTSSDKVRLDSMESGATADMTGAEIVAAIDTELGNSTWQSGGGAGGGNLVDLGDVNITSPGASEDGYGIIWDNDTSRFILSPSAGGQTNLSATGNTTTVTVASSTGDDATIFGATGSQAGVMRAADYLKLQGIEDGAEVNPTGTEIVTLINTELGSSDWQAGGAGSATNLGFSVDATTITITSSSGDDIVLPGATGSDAGILTAAMWSKLNGIEVGATADQTGAEIVSAIDTELGSTDWQSGGGGGGSFKGLRLVQNSAQSINAGESAILNWSSGEVIDTDGYFDDATSATTVTIPAGVSRVVITAGYRSTNVSSATCELVILYNGPPLARTRVTTTNASGSLTTGVLDVTPGDTFQIGLYSTLAMDTSASETYLTVQDITDGGSAGGGGGSATDLSVTRDGTSVTVASSTGEDAVLPVADGSNAGVLSAADKTKLDGIEAGAEVNPTGAEIEALLDTELGGTDWKTGGGTPTGSELITILDSSMGTNLWRAGSHGAHSYWRVRRISNTSTSYAGFAEILFGSNTNTGGTVVSNDPGSISGPLGASKAFDGDPNSKWRASPITTPDLWAGYQFSSPVFVDYVTLTSENEVSGADVAMSAFYVDYSDDGTTWITAWTVTNAGWTSGAQTQTFYAPDAISGSKIVDSIDAELGSVNWRTGGTSIDIQESTENYVVTDSDLTGVVIRKINSASATTVTVNTGLTGTEPLTVVRKGAGTVTFVAGAGVTIQSADGLLALRSQFSSATLIPDGTDTYLLVGDLA